MASVSKSLPPPVGGWDTRNALADMPAENAVILDNFFPSTDKVTIRPGFTQHVTGLSGNVESLLEYTALSGTGKIFACNNGKIYDVSTAGAVGSALVTSRSNNKFQSVQIGTSGGQFLLAVNGADTPQVYNGSTWGNATFSGPTIANLIWCNVHQRRLWFGETNKLTAWYLATNAITGTATEFPLYGIASLGGHIMAMETWSTPSNNFQNDLAVFLTSEGQAIIYQGTDPSAASTWQLVGVFRIGKPIGRRCMIKAGADILIITEDGFVALSDILGGDVSQTDRVSISAQINKAVNDAVRDQAGTFGWEPFIYPKGTMLVFNIPVSATTFYQFVFNTITSAPTRFTGMNALCWALNEDNPYFGGTDGKVYRFDSGTSDNGANIEADALQAFNYFGSKAAKKAFKLAEPIFQSAGAPNAALDLNIDFDIKLPTGIASAGASVGGLWGTALWGSGLWGSESQVYAGWRGVRGIGRAAALRVRINTTSSSPAWISTNFVFVPGGQI